MLSNIDMVFWGLMCLLCVVVVMGSFEFLVAGVIAMAALIILKFALSARK